MKGQPPPLPTSLAIDPLLTEKETAGWLRMSLRTLARKRKAGLIHAIPWNARRYRYRKSEVERFICATEQTTRVYFGGRPEEIFSGHEVVTKAPTPKPRGNPARSLTEKESKQAAIAHLSREYLRREGE